MIQRMTGGINLGPSNLNGSYKFLSLETRDIIVRRSWTELPVPNDVIMRVEEMLNDMQDDILRELEDQEIDMLNDISNDEGVREDKGFMETPVESEHTDVSVEERTIEDLEPENLEPENLIEEDMIEEAGPEVINEIEDEKKRNVLTDEDKESDKENMRNDSRSNSITTRYNLRPNRTPSYLHRFVFLSVHAGVQKWGDKVNEAIKDNSRC
jgi:hypothetical protein